MKKYSILVGQVASFAVAFAVILSVSVSHVQAQTVSCSSGIGSPLLVNVTQHIANDPDSGTFGGNWALDNFDRHIQIWAEGDHYCAQADDNGTFTTFGGVDGKSPQTGTALPQVITGTMVGGTHGVLTGTLGDAGTWGSTGTAPAQDCHSTDCSMTSLWVQNYFPGGTYDFGNNWGWTYASPTGEAWVNSGASNTGDIHAVFDTNTHVGYQNLQDAITGATAGDTIALAGNVTTSAQVTVNKSLTVDGKGFMLHANFSGNVPANTNNAAIGVFSPNVTIKNLTEDGTGSTGIHGINIYDVMGINLNDVTATHNPKAGITVNSSSVTANNISTSGNAWGGINVDQKTASASSLTVTGISHHTEALADIWIDDVTKNVSVADSGNQYAFSNTGNLRVYKLKSIVTSSAPEVVVTSPTQPVNVTIDAGTTNPTINFDALVTNGTGTLPATNIDSATTDVAIPAATVVTSTDTSWNGVISAPIATTVFVLTPDAGQTATAISAVEIGAGNTPLTFSKAVKLTFAGQEGKLIGWSQSGSFHAITNDCSADAQATMDTELIDGSDCKIDSGADLVVWTKHFTTFVVYTQAATPVSSGSGNISGRRQDISNLIASTGTVNPNAGQVLGAFTTSDNQAQIVLVKQQLAALINQLIQLLQGQLAAAIAAGQM